MNDTQLPKAKD